jgi:predicted NBD/HSP70 family sugar kinase
MTDRELAGQELTRRARPNEERVLALLGRAGRASRADLARQLAIPKATVADIVADLIGRQLITPVSPAARPAAPGRPAQVLALTGPAPAIAALTWTSGQLRWAIATLSGTVLSDGVTVPEPSTDRSLADLADDSLARAARLAGYEVAALAAVVLSVPAPFQRGVGTAVTVPAAHAAAGARRMTTWLDQELAAELARRTGRPVLVENDANLGALGEHAFGAGRGKPDQVYVKFGRASVGAGLIIGDRLHRGSSGFAGELAHVQVRDNGPVCACGGRGCLIRTISTEMIDLAQPAYEQPLTFSAMLSLAEAGDIGLQRLLGDFGRGIGRPLADACTLLNPDLFVLDGSIGPAGHHIIGGMTEAIERHACPATSAAVRVVAGSLGARAETLGAVVLVRQEHDRGRAEAVGSPKDRGPAPAGSGPVRRDMEDR